MWLAAFSILLQPLYYQASSDNLAYVTKVHANTPSPLKGGARLPSFEWDFGFKVGAQYQMPHDAWQLSLNLTHFHTHTDDEQKACDLWQLIPLVTLPRSFGTVFVDAANMHWRLHLGLIDGLCSKKWSPSPAFACQLSLGLRTGWIRQKFQLEYLGGDFAEVQGVALSMKNKFFGLGPAIGGTLKWKIAPQWALIGSGMGSILYGSFYLHQAEWEILHSQRVLGVHDGFHCSVPVVDGEVGICWQSATERCVIELMWDQTLLWGQSHWLYFHGG